MKITAKAPVRRRSKTVKLAKSSGKVHTEFIHKNGTVTVVKVRGASEKAKLIVERMAGSGHGKYTTEQIMKLTRG